MRGTEPDPPPSPPPTHTKQVEKILTPSDILKPLAPPLSPTAIYANNIDIYLTPAYSLIVTCLTDMQRKRLVHRKTD